MVEKLFTIGDEYQNPSLEAGHGPVFMNITIASNGSTDVEYKEGTVLAKVTASGKYVGYDPDGIDGSEAAVTILARDITVLATGDFPTQGWRHGSFNKNALVWTAADITDEEKATAIAALDAVNIYAQGI